MTAAFVAGPLVAVIQAAEGAEVVPQTRLHLVGSKSLADAGAIASYAWSVVQPVGSASVFMPSASVADPTFEVNVAGTYVFELIVKDAFGNTASQEFTALVVPDQSIHVELLWDTPTDPDQSDEGPEAGADLDLHFVHPDATGLDVDDDAEPDGWFDHPYDAFWFNN